MRLPSPSYGDYLEFVATVVVTMSVLQYPRVAGATGPVDYESLVGTALALPEVTHVLTVVCANITRVSQWDRMVRNQESGRRVHDGTSRKK